MLLQLLRGARLIASPSIMYRAKTLQLLVLAFAMLTLVTRQPGNLKVANAQGVFTY